MQLADRLIPSRELLDHFGMLCREIVRFAGVFEQPSSLANEVDRVP